MEMSSGRISTKKKGVVGQEIENVEIKIHCCHVYASRECIRQRSILSGRGGAGPKLCEKMAIFLLVKEATVERFIVGAGAVVVEKKRGRCTRTAVQTRKKAGKLCGGSGSKRCFLILEKGNGWLLQIRSVFLSS